MAKRMSKADWPGPTVDEIDRISAKMVRKRRAIDIVYGFIIACAGAAVGFIIVHLI